ncbi:MAG: trigger factor, partial [Clostridiales bacterium]
NFTKRPEVTLGQYKGLALTRRILELDDSDVEKELQAQRERMSQLIDVEGDEAAQLGDTVTIDFKGTKEDIPFDGGTAENYPLELGSGSFIPGFEEQIVGMKKDEDKAIAVAFPTEYHQKDLAGQPVVFQVHVHEIKRKQLPQLNDEFAQEASETANTLEQFKAELKTGLNEQNHNAADEDCKNSGVKIAVENAQADIPPIMIEQRLDDIIEDMNQRMDAQGLKMEQFFAYTGSNMGQLRENYRAQAELGVKTDLVLESMIKLENFTVTDEEIAAEVKELSTKYWQPEDKVREALEQSGQMEMVKQGIKVRKAVELIFDSAVISDEVVTHAQVEAERQDRAAQAAKTAAEAEAQIQMAQAAKAEIINTETEEDGPLIDAE